MHCTSSNQTIKKKSNQQAKHCFLYEITKLCQKLKHKYSSPDHHIFNHQKHSRLSKKLFKSNFPVIGQIFNHNSIVYHKISTQRKGKYPVQNTNLALTVTMQASYPNKITTTIRVIIRKKSIKRKAHKDTDLP